MAWILLQVREKTNECERKVREYKNLINESNDDEVKAFYTDVLANYENLVRKGNGFIDRQIGKFEILS